MGGKSARTKGHNFERWIAKKLREIFPGARRGLQYQDGKKCADVVDAGPWHWECKVGKKPGVRTALKQAEIDCSKGMIPVAVIKDDRAEPFVVLPFDDFLEMVGQLTRYWRG